MDVGVHLRVVCCVAGRSTCCASRYVLLWTMYVLLCWDVGYETQYSSAVSLVPWMYTLLHMYGDTYWHTIGILLLLVVCALLCIGIRLHVRWIVSTYAEREMVVLYSCVALVLCSMLYKYCGLSAAMLCTVAVHGSHVAIGMSGWVIVLSTSACYTVWGASSVSTLHGIVGLVLYWPLVYGV